MSCPSKIRSSGRFMQKLLVISLFRSDIKRYVHVPKCASTVDQFKQKEAVLCLYKVLKQEAVFPSFILKSISFYFESFSVTVDVCSKYYGLKNILQSKAKFL